MITSTVPASPGNLADLEPKDLLWHYAAFPFYQEFGKCLHHNPTIKACGMNLALDGWNYHALAPEARKLLDDWTHSEAGAAEFENRLLSASTRIWERRRNYHGLLVDVAKRIDAEQSAGNFLQREEAITVQLLKRLNEGFQRLYGELSDAQRKNIDDALQMELQRLAVQLGKKSPLEWFIESTAAGTVAYVLERCVNEVILEHLSRWHRVLHTIGMYKIAWWIPLAILAPYKAGTWVYSLGTHNYEKTIPCVVKLYRLRNQAIDKNDHPPAGIDPTAAF